MLNIFVPGADVVGRSDCWLAITIESLGLMLVLMRHLLYWFRELSRNDSLSPLVSRSVTN